jgi:hypothetical protein
LLGWSSNPGAITMKNKNKKRERKLLGYRISSIELRKRFKDLLATVVIN